MLTRLAPTPHTAASRLQPSPAAAARTTLTDDDSAMLLSSATAVSRRLIGRRRLHGIAAAAVARGVTPPLVRRRPLSSASTGSSDKDKEEGERPLIVTRAFVEGGAPGAVVATLAMNRPKARNALSRAMVQEVSWRTKRDVSIGRDSMVWF